MTAAVRMERVMRQKHGGGMPRKGVSHVPVPVTQHRCRSVMRLQARAQHPARGNPSEEAPAVAGSGLKIDSLLGMVYFYKFEVLISVHCPPSKRSTRKSR
jgi:hypothetical protein